jgi:hypothetical protein
MKRVEECYIVTNVVFFNFASTGSLKELVEHGLLKTFHHNVQLSIKITVGRFTQEVLG